MGLRPEETPKALKLAGAGFWKCKVGGSGRFGEKP